MGDAVNARPTGDRSSGERDEQQSSQNFQPGATGYGTSQTTYPPINTYQHQSQSQVRPESFNMSSIGNALPPYQDFSASPAHRFSSSPSALNYQMPNAQSFMGSQLGPAAANLQYNNTFGTPFQGQYIPHAGSQQAMQGLINSAGQYYSLPNYGGQSQPQPQNYYVQQSHYPAQNPAYPVAAGVPFAGRGNFAGEVRQNQQRGKEFSGQASIYGQQGRSASIASSSGHSTVVRGPPRKPRQSGHAIWIGNLPPQTDLMSLVLHVCKETIGLESLFLISKSNCAFANFKDETTCIEAQAKIHDSRFQTVRLVSRLRRNSVGTASGTPVPTGPGDSEQFSTLPAPRTPSIDGTEGETESKEAEVSSELSRPQDPEENIVSKDKYFIVKSLTVEDLELSVRNGIWATQSHNEEALNKAYQTAENVYLVFSANKSGEYFGYARMISPINDDPAAAIEFAPKAQPVEDPTGELPKAIPTPASEFAPKGRIIDDSARGTIFWEAERDESEDEEEEDANKSEHDGAPPAKAWGKPFKLEWISTTRLPFYRTRGLRNPWNSNREVKIARDGTELETSIGRRLLGLFHRVPSPIGPHHQMPPIHTLPGYPPHMRGFQG